MTNITFKLDTTNLSPDTLHTLELFDLNHMTFDSLESIIDFLNFIITPPPPSNS